MTALRWWLLSVADWFQARSLWRCANLLDRLAMAIYRLEQGPR